MTKAECLAEIERIGSDPACAAEPGSLYLYNKKALARLDRLRRQVTWWISEDRRLAGNPVRADGYSGRKSNRRR